MPLFYRLICNSLNINVLYILFLYPSESFINSKTITIMKQTLLSFLLALLPIVASADAVVIDEIYYNLVPKAKSAEVTSNPNKYSGNIDIPETVTYDGVTYDVKLIGNGAFAYCEDLISVNIPNSITSIGNISFVWCTGLSTLTLPSSVKSIGSGAFAFTELSGIYISDLSAWLNIDFGEEYEGLSSNPLSNAGHLYLNNGRTRIFPWQPPQTLHDSINIGVNPYPYILQTL